MSLKGLFDGKIVTGDDAISVRRAPQPGAPHLLEMTIPLNMSEAASLNRFGTIMFGEWIMSPESFTTDKDDKDKCPCFRIDEARQALDMGGWWPLVPDCYKAAVAEIIERLFPDIHNTRVDRDRLALFLVELRNEIWLTVEPTR